VVKSWTEPTLSLSGQVARGSKLKLKRAFGPLTTRSDPGILGNPKTGRPGGAAQMLIAIGMALRGHPIGVEMVGRKVADREVPAHMCFSRSTAKRQGGVGLTIRLLLPTARLVERLAQQPPFWLSLRS
jgi:hypothetical protein